MRTAKINEIANEGEKESIKSINFYPDWPQEREDTNHQHEEMLPTTLYP